MILSVFCILLALIGIGNVFSNTFGFIRQRRREFARLLSVGMTPEGMKKVFCIEALMFVGRPVLSALLVTAAAVKQQTTDWPAVRALYNRFSKVS